MSRKLKLIKEANKLLEKRYLIEQSNPPAPAPPAPNTPPASPPPPAPSTPPPPASGATETTNVKPEDIKKLNPCSSFNNVQFNDSMKRTIKIDNKEVIYYMKSDGKLPLCIKK